MVTGNELGDRIPSNGRVRGGRDDGEPLRVLFVMGAGRAGSTILGITLGNCEGVLYAGELDKWLLRRGKPLVADDPRLAFWGSVRGRMTDAEALFGIRVWNYFERSSAVFRREAWSARRRLRARYLAVAEHLYEVVAETAGVRRVVDTGHYPLRARELQRLSGIELHLVFLVRQPQALVASYQRRDVAERSFNVPVTNAYLWLTYLVSSWVFWRHPKDRRLLVRYEDFLADTEGVVAQLLDQLGSRAPMPDLSALRTGVPFQSNRVARASVVSLKRDPPAPPRRSWLTTLAQSPWSVVFTLLRPQAGPRPPDRRSPDAPSGTAAHAATS